ncbi:MAG: phosphotransferase [candidate division WS1 bacterium]|jgi:homoserine kinase type II|nr:phosphotransferase [candidate division WS1 bacterium]
MRPARKLLEPEEAVGILRHWEIAARPADVSSGSGTANASAIIVSPRGRLMLRRRNPRYARADWTGYDHALLAHLAGEGLPVPVGVPAPDGRAFIVSGQHIYELFEFIEGEQHEAGNAEQLHAAGVTLGRLHRSASGYDPPVMKRWPRFHDPADAAEGLFSLLADAQGEAAGLLDQALRLARSLVERLPDALYWSLPQTVVQGDYHPANLKFRGEEVVGVFDWDWASRQPRMVDLADALLFFCGVRESPLIGGDIWSLTEAFRIAPERVAALGAGYLQEIAPTAEELAALPDLMRCRWLYCRVDAAQRKVEASRRVEFVTRRLEVPLHDIDRLEPSLSDGTAFEQR